MLYQIQFDEAFPTLAGVMPVCMGRGIPAIRISIGISDARERAAA
jgi:hypothetical protein